MAYFLLKHSLADLRPYFSQGTLNRFGSGVARSHRRDPVDAPGILATINPRGASSSHNDHEPSTQAPAGEDGS